jgi:hypothetical protein
MEASGFERPISQALVRLQQVTATGHAPAWPCAAHFCSRLATNSNDVFVFGYGFGESGVTPNFTWRRNLAKSAMQFCPHRQHNNLKLAKFGEIANYKKHCPK